MAIDITRTRKYLKDFDLKTLFIEELGWDHCTKHFHIPADDHNFMLIAVAEKRGMVAFICSNSTDGHIPSYAIRREIERQLAKSIHEHIIIYTDSGKTKQIWQWVKREAGRPTACREHAYHRNQPGDSLVQKLQAIEFSIADEENLTIVDAAGRVRTAFDVERVTKRFYDRFKTEHDAFLDFIKGIPDDELQRWYASVMLNRLMFIYFIQKKGFLDGNPDYLRTKLIQSRQHGKDHFYRDFLSPLFFEGFAKKEGERSPSTNRLLGKVPYLNGGLFLKHQIEERHGRNIEIKDSAFERLFDFFDQYQWHLDERPLRRDNEINPDVLGYIFEKYINQKQMGAYYTKEDITEYISKNTVIPFLFDAAKLKCKIAFEGEINVWRLLHNDPDRYIYNAVTTGIIDAAGNIIPESVLPDFVQKGMHDPKARMFDKRYNLGEADLRDTGGKKLTLPTETWREYVERRKRCLELRSRLANGEIWDINDLITYNLNIRQFAQDVIENCEGPELLRAFYHAIEKVTVLDPTCGSGAFLFAALNILEPLYEACLDRMEVFLDELERSGEKRRPEKFSDFKKILRQIDEHPNRRYFILKSIIVNNLYGVDIMEEAIEICKLRLFLKLVAQVESAEHIAEPLPDIDFNIRAGNSLVGYTSIEEVKRSMEGDWIKLQSLPVIEEKAQDVDRLFKLFHQQQTELGGEVTPESKQELRSRLKILEDKLNSYLANEYGIDPKKKVAYDQWLKSHHPFHWFIEFYGIIKTGGFDVIIGNPPYVEYSKVKSDYNIRGYKTESCGNLYAYVMERSLNLIKGRSGLIVPISLACSERMSQVRKLNLAKCSNVWVSNFAIRPQPLFPEIMQRNTVVISQSGDSQNNKLFSTNYLRWTAIEREYLFRKLWFAEISNLDIKDNVIIKIATTIEYHVLENIKIKCPTSIGKLADRPLGALYFHDSGESYWTKTLLDKPMAYRNGLRVEPSQWFNIDIPSADVPFVYLLLNSIHSVLNNCA